MYNFIRSVFIHNFGKTLYCNFFFFLELNTPVLLFHDFIQRQRCNSSEYIICTLSTQLIHKNCQHIAFEILSTYTCMKVSFQNFIVTYIKILYILIYEQVLLFCQTMKCNHNTLHEYRTIYILG